MRSLVLTIGGAIVGVLSLGCAGATSVVGRPIEAGRTYHSAYLVTHSDDSRADVSAAIQSNLFKRGYLVSAGPEAKAPENIDLIVRYTDSWSWDLAMYLTAVSILVYDGKTQTLIGSGSWTNHSLLHNFDNADSVVATIIDDIGRKVGLAAYAR